MWHHNAAATVETMALASSTGLIAALSTAYWGADGPAIDAMKLIIQVQIMATYVIQGVTSIQPLISVALIVWTYIMDFEKMMAWTICIYNWTYVPCKSFVRIVTLFLLNAYIDAGLDIIAIRFVVYFTNLLSHMLKCINTQPGTYCLGHHVRLGYHYQHLFLCRIYCYLHLLS